MESSATLEETGPAPIDLVAGADRKLHWKGRVFDAAIGIAGIAREKREGDGATPAGRFPLRRVLYRPDRLAPPATQLPVAPISPRDGWCDDAADALYNQQIRQPFSARFELLWRDDPLYDILVVLGYNDSPVAPGRGSAIFLHLATPDYRETRGCVALAKDHLLELLKGCDARALLWIVDGPAESAFDATTSAR